MHKNEFVQAINSGFRSGGMFCTLTDTDLGNYLLEKVMEFMGTDHPRTLQAVENVGQQAVDPPVFALSPQVWDISFVVVKSCSLGSRWRFSFTLACIFLVKLDVVWFEGHSGLNDQQFALGQNVLGGNPSLWQDIPGHI